MGIRNFPVISIGTSTGFPNAVFQAGGAATSFPTMQNGKKAKYLWCMATGGASTNVCTISVGTASIGTAGTGMLLPHNPPVPVILNVHGQTRIKKYSTGDGATRLWMIPLEDF